MNRTNLTALFQPSSIAVIGASSDKLKPGGRTFRYLAERFGGKLFAVNARGVESERDGVYVSVASLPYAPDLAVIAVPASAVVGEVEACSKKGVKVVVVYTSGFGELGEAGRREQERLAEIAASSGMRILGPNCMGAFNLHMHSYTTFTSTLGHAEWPKAGNIGIASQSGAVASHLLSMVRDAGFGVSCWVATGNEADIDIADCIAYLADDPQTSVIAGYLEGCRDGARLIEALERARVRRKPVIVMKVGRSMEGAAAAASHTGALAGSDEIYQTVFERHGVCRANSYEEFLDLVVACSRGGFPKGRNLGIASISGGAGVMIADYAGEAGLRVPALTESTQARFKEAVPIAGVRNPVDITAKVVTSPELLGLFLDGLLAEVHIDCAVLYLSNMGRNAPLFTRMREAIRSLPARHAGKLIAVVATLPQQARQQLEEDGYLLYEDPLRAVRTLAHLAQIASSFDAPERRPMAASAHRFACQPSGNEWAALQALRAAGIPVVESCLVTSAQDAAAAASRLNGPVALKIASADIAHKSEIGGVMLGVRSPAAAATAFDQLMERVRGAAPAARIDGVLVAPMVAGGVEVILGTKRDPVFGPVVMFGIGGIFVEIFQDVTFRVAPIDNEEAGRMIREIKSFPILAGARGRQAVDLDALASALSTLSHVAAANIDRIDSIEINPFIALPVGGVAVDGLIVAA
ncbi:acetate--CoA ligase family protein [Comamonadaceae bacterium G21597-S1]|nr:acetate--CoA ligase family protein [Comamonadaceae bacterium G21597-S1]